MAYRVTGAIFGMLFVFTALKIASNVRATYPVKVLSFVLLISCGGTLLFFGYLENYAPQYAMVLLYMALVFHMFRTKGSALAPGVVLAICCLFHYQNLVLIPSFVVAVVMLHAVQQGTSVRQAASVYRYGLYAIPLLLVAYGFFQWHPLGALETGHNPFIPFNATGGMKYTLLSPMHIIDIVWEHLLLAPVSLVVLIVIGISLRTKIDWHAPEIVVVVVATVALESFLIGGNLGNGLARDWDVVATLGPMLTLLAIRLLEQASSHIGFHRRLITATGTIALLSIASWIAVNVATSTEVNRYVSLLEYHQSAVKPSVTRYGYESLRKMYIRDKDWQDEVMIDEAMIASVPWHVDLLRAIRLPEQVGMGNDTVVSLTLERILRHVATTAGDSTLRAETAGEEGTLRIAPSHAGIPTSLGDLLFLGATRLNQYYTRWTLDDVRAFSDTIIHYHPLQPYGYELKGWVQFINRESEAAEVSIQRAIALDSTRAHPLVQLGSYYNFVGRHDSARMSARRALKLDDGYLDAARLLFGTMHTAVVTPSDTNDVRLIILGARRSLEEARLRQATEEDIKQAKRILAESLSAWLSITGTDFE